MKFLSTKDVVGDFIPNAYIDKVTLESSGVPPKVVNPHIIDPRESSTSETGQENEVLRVTVDISIKDTILNQQATWLKSFQLINSNFNIQELFKVYIAQINDPGKVQQFQPSLNYISQNLDREDYQEILLSELNGDIDSPNTLSEVDEDFNRIYNIPHSFTFETNNLNPPFLAHFCWVELDMVKLAQQFNFEGIEAVESLGINTKSEIAYDSSIKNGKVVEKAFYFEDDSGSIWTGPVIQMANGQWMTVTTPMTNSVAVNKITTQNTKVQDFRTVKRLEKVNLDFSVIQNGLKDDVSFESKSRTANLSLDRDTKAFSSLFISRDRNNDARFMFAIDVARILESNSEFPQLLKNEKTKWPVVLNSSIKSIQLRRIRLAGSPEAGAEPRYISNDTTKRPVRFEYGVGTSPVSGTMMTTDEDELIFESFPVNNIVSEDDQNLRQFNGDSIITRRTKPQPNIFYYTGIDRTMSGKSDGFYQYKVIVSLEDGSVEYLEDQISLLILEKDKLKQYLSRASEIGTPGFRNPFSDPHIDPPWENKGYTGGRTQLESRDASPGNYNQFANKFTQNFIQDEEGKETGPENYIWNTASNIYGNIYANLTGEDQGSQSIIQIKDSLQNYLSPRTGNPNGIQTVIDLYNNLIENIERHVKVVRVPRIDISSINNLSGMASMGQQSNADKVVEIAFTFPEIYNANLSVDKGTDVLGMSEVTGSGLRVLTGAEFVQMTNNEVEKIFSTGSSQLALTEYYGPEVYSLNSLNVTDYSYFTPTMIVSGDESVTLTESETPTKYESVLNNTETNNANSVASFLASAHNISIVGDKEVSLPFNSPFVQGEERQSNTDINIIPGYQGRAIDSQNNEGRLSQQLSLLSRNLSTISDTTQDNNLSLYDPANSAGYAKSLTVNEVGQLPNQIKGLISYGTNEANDPAGQNIFNDDALEVLRVDGPTNISYAPKYQYKFETIYELEVFNGWQEQSDSTGSSAPLLFTAMSDTWVTMNRSIYLAAQQETKSLFCRLKRYENPKVGISANPSSEPPLFEEYFMINPDGTGLPSPFFIEPSELIRTSQPSPPASYLRTDTTVRRSAAEVALRQAFITGFTGSAGGGAIAEQTTSATSATPGSVGGRVTANTLRPPTEQAEQGEASFDPNTGVSTTSTAAGDVPFTQGTSGNSSGDGFGGF